MKNFTLLLITIALLGCVQSKKITIQLSIIDNQFKFPVSFGNSQCKLYIAPQIDSCSNIITQSAEGTDLCGCDYMGANIMIHGNDYQATFQLGNTQADLIFTAPTFNGQSPYYYGTNQLCFGFQPREDYSNTIYELIGQNMISEGRVYFNLNPNAAHFGDNSNAGEIDIGSPNVDFINQGLIFKLIKVQAGENSYAGAVTGSIKMFGQSFYSPSIVFFKVNSPVTQITSEAYEKILETFDQKGIRYVNYGAPDFIVNLFTIEQLEPIEVTLLEYDNTPFTLKILPSQYTRKLTNGSYFLLLKPWSQNRSITIGYPIFETYYTGFDLSRQQIVIGEKLSQKEHTNNFRGSSTITE